MESPVVQITSKSHSEVLNNMQENFVFQNSHAETKQNNTLIMMINVLFKSYAWKLHWNRVKSLRESVWQTEEVSTWSLMAQLEGPRFKFLMWRRLCSIFVYVLGAEIRFAYFPTKGIHEGVCVIFKQKWEVTPCMSSNALLLYSLTAKIKFSLPQKNFHPLAMVLFILRYPPPNLDLPAFSITIQLNKTFLSRTISK